MNETSDVKIEISAGLGWISINRPKFRNAVRPETMVAIKSAIWQLENDENVRAIILSGEGSAFSAGADFKFLEELKTMSQYEIRNRIYDDFVGAVCAVALCRKPTLASVRGVALTVGCELAIACDFRLADETARFQETWVKMGLIPPLGGMFLLPQLVGLSKAREMILTGLIVHAKNAESIGLVNAVLPCEILEQETRDFAQNLAKLPPQAYAAAKEGIRRGLESSLEREWAVNPITQSVMMKTRDFSEAVDALKQNRPPVFDGT